VIVNGRQSSPKFNKWQGDYNVRRNFNIGASAYAYFIGKLIIFILFNFL